MTVATFAASLFVVIVSCFLTPWQVADLLPKLAADLGLRRVPELECERAALRLAQGLDVAVNFPAAVLTFIAFLSLDAFQSVKNWAASLIMMAILIVFVVIGRPQVAGWYWTVSIFRRVSIVSFLLLIANVVGLVLALRESSL